MFRTILEFFWRLLPDRCEVDGCCRKGVRGNENIVNGMIMCDYCSGAAPSGCEMSGCDWGSIVAGVVLFAVVVGILVAAERSGSGRDNPQL